jgi:teichuronic acid biosynthesis glycosyltransferase TuaG
MNNDSFISVIIPAYNSVKYIEETINSVLAQTYSNFEIIIVDDSSTDGTFELCKKLSESNNKIKVFRIEHSGRPSVPRNFGINKAQGEFIAFLDSDDKWVKNKLKEQINFFKKNSEVSLVYSVSKTFGEVNFFSQHYELFPLPFKAAKNKTDLLTKGNSIPLSTVMVKTETVRSAGGFDEDPDLKLEDYDLWIRLSDLGELGFLPRVHCYYRIHKNQFSGNWQTKKNILDYLSKKRGIALPPYKYYRTKGKFILLIRNTIHFKFYLLIKLFGWFNRKFNL